MEEQKKLKLNLKEFERYGNLFDMSERKELIGEMLKTLRQASGATQAEIADYLGIKVGTYSTYEKGTREAPAEIVVRLSILYDVPTDVILQQSRYSKDGYVAQKQIDQMNDQLDELRSIITNQNEELNPEFASLMTMMTDAFSKMNEQLTEFNKNQENK